MFHCQMSCYGQDGTKKRVRTPTLPAATLGGDRSFGMDHTMDQVSLAPPAGLMNGYYMEVKPRRPSSGGEAGPAPASRGAKCQLGRVAGQIPRIPCNPVGTTSGSRHSTHRIVAISIVQRSGHMSASATSSIMSGITCMPVTVTTTLPLWVPLLACQQ